MHLMSRENLNAGETLPSYYGENRLVLLPRDPYWLFAYWEITPSACARVEHKLGKERWKRAQITIRINRYVQDGGKVEGYFNIAVESPMGNWHINTGVPDRMYEAILGWQLPEGEFYPLLHSNKIVSPRDSISNIIDENWRLPNWKSRRLFWRISRYEATSPRFFMWSRKKRHKQEGYKWPMDTYV